jgi:hypothetical protein
MTVEVATYISSLDTSLPAGGDTKSEGDNHIRLIKSTLKTTFPNINGAMTATDEELSCVKDGADASASLTMGLNWSKGGGTTLKKIHSKLVAFTLVASATANGVGNLVCTLPAGYRPPVAGSGVFAFATYNDASAGLDYYGAVQISTTGQVIITTTGTGSLFGGARDNTDTVNLCIVFPID